MIASNDIDPVPAGADTDVESGVAATDSCSLEFPLYNTSIPAVCVPVTVAVAPSV